MVVRKLPPNTRWDGSHMPVDRLIEGHKITLLGPSPLAKTPGFIGVMVDDEKYVITLKAAMEGLMMAVTSKIIKDEIKEKRRKAHGNTR